MSETNQLALALQSRCAPNGDVFDSDAGHSVGLVDVPAVEDEGAFHDVADAVELEAAEFLPLGHDDQRIRVLRHGVGAVEILNILWQQRAGILHGDGVVGREGRLVFREFVDHFDGFGIAHVVGIGLEGQAKDPKALSLQVLHDFLDSADEARRAFRVYRDHRFQNVEVLAEFLRRVDQRQRVLWKARAAVAQTRGEELLADALVRAHALGHQGHVGADVTLVAKGMGTDKRIGKEFLAAGLGYGGSCFPKDTLSLIHTAKEFGEDFDILEAVVAVNAERTPRFIRRIKEVMKDLKGKRFGVLGLAFKPDTDDMRDAKSVEVINELAKDEATFAAYDPIAVENARPLLPKDVEYLDSPYAVAKDADALIIMTEWKEFRGLKFDRIRDIMKRPLIFDGRNIYQPDRMARIGIEYVAIGRAAGLKC